MKSRIFFRKFAVYLLFFFLSIFVLSKLIFNAKIFGRYLDFSLPPVSYLMVNAFKSSLFAWSHAANGGAPNSFGTTLVPVNLLLYLPLIFTRSVWFIARYQMVLTLFLGLSFFYLLSLRLLAKTEPSSMQIKAISLAASVFFVFNNYIFSDLIFGSNVMLLTFVFIPLLLYSIISYFEAAKYNKYYFVLALLSLLIISSTMQHLVLAYLLIFLFATIYKDKIFFFWLVFLHLILSLYWILPLFATLVSVKSLELAKDYSSGILVSSSEFIPSVINSEYFGNRDMYRLSLGSVFLVKIWTTSAFLLVPIALSSFFNLRNFSKTHKKIIISSLFVFLLSLLFIKGGHDPFGGVVTFLYNYFPLLKLFRSPQRFLSFYVISISILFVLSCSRLFKNGRSVIYLVFALVLINAMPWWLTRDLGTKTLSENTKLPTLNQFDLSNGEEKFYALNKSPLNFSLMTVPPGQSINFVSPLSGDILSQGGDAGLALGNKGFYAPEQAMAGFGGVLDRLEQEMYLNENFFDEYQKVFAYLNIRYFIIRKNTSPNFSKSINDFNFESIEKSIKNSDKIEEIYRDDSTVILQNKNFIPPVYSPCIVTKSQLARPTLKSLATGTQKLCDAVYFNSRANSSNKILIDLPDQAKDPSVVEYKKINPTKYRIVIHKAADTQPVIISEAFNSGWKAYVANIAQNEKGETDRSILVSQINSSYAPGYDEQASKEELVSFVNDGIVSAVGQSGSAKFISKNLAGTVQNDNLSDGSIAETWFNAPLNEESHLEANGYANSWIINPSQICPDSGKCTKNSDGSYNIELVVEFWPQRLFYLGSIISACTLIICLAFCLGLVNKNKRRINAEKNN